jgi:hypothetical protein
MEPFRDEAELIAELRALREAPRPEFAAELDELAAAGFPRRPSDAGSRFAALTARLRTLPPRRSLFTAGAAALATVALVAVVVASNESGSGPVALNEGGAPTPVRPHPGASGNRVETQVPAPSAATPSAGSSSGSASSANEATGGVEHRDVERSAEIVLGAEPADVGEDSEEVFQAVHGFDGIVLNSSTSQGRAGRAGASFELLIPSARLADALAAFSAIDVVRSRHEATLDITAPTVTVGEELRGSQARIDGLLAQLAAAETESEREVVEAELDAERRHAATLRAHLANLHRRTQFSRVSLRIETGGPKAPSSGGGWGIGGAWHDAGHILAVAAGVLLVSLAVLAPFVLIALLAWLASRLWLRRARERALG